MNLITFSLKSAAVKWWRSLTLGFLILAAAFIIISAGSFITAIRHKVENVIIRGVTGHIQIRSENSREGDMVEQYNKGWDAIQPMNPITVAAIQKLLHLKFPQVETALLIRRSGFLTNLEKKEATMLIGIEPGAKQYKDAFLLKEGRYLNSKNGAAEILLTEEQAASFHVKTGDMITITTKNQYGLNARLDLKVAGIGNFIMLSLFSYKACYLSNEAMRKLLHLGPGSATDIILFTGNPGQTFAIIRNLSRELSAAKIDNTITAGEMLKSSELKITEFDVKEDLTSNRKVKISSYTEMGLSFKSIGDTMSVMLNLLVLFLMIIVSVLIVNLVYLMGLERYREIGTMRALGFSRNQVARIFIGEILSISLLFGVLGSMLSAGLTYFLGRAGIPSPIPAMDFIMGKSLSLELDLVQVPITLGVITCFSLAASLYPAYQACSMDPAQTLRS
ncbi:MAG: FtsX-like permease family protein [Firmicutes bacterium]|nr:FtsX-like permease family protein [Bacillota bacterium]